MPFHSHHHHNHNQQPPNPATGIFQSAGALGLAVAAPNLQRLASGTTAAGTDTFAPSNDSIAYGRSGQASNLENMANPLQTNRLGLDPSTAPPMSAPATSDQPFNTPRRTHTQRASEDLRIPSNAPPLQQAYTPQHPQSLYEGSYSAAPAFNVQQATPQGGSQPSSVVPSNAGVPGALQPAGGRPVPISSYSTSNVPPMQIQTNAQQYTQTPSRSSTLHNHSPSMDGGSQKYIPFSQNTPTSTPTTSNPKAYNLSQHTQTPAGHPSHSPLNLTDIRSRAVSDANDSGGSGTAAFHSYSDSATNSNYLAPFATYAYDWCKWPVLGGSGAGKMAVGSYLEDPHNFIQILDTQISAQEVTSPGAPAYGLEYTKIAEATCAYPVTRILWEPPSSQKQSTDLLATSGDHLRLWSLPQQTSTPQHQGSNSINNRSSSAQQQAPQKLQPLALLSNSKTPEHTAPLTSLDWNTLSPKLIITSSIDTTCTIWDIPTLTAKTQLIAHDKEVFDVRFCAGSVDVFVSCGADGSVRMFDLRSLEHSTIIYEPVEKGEKGASPSSSSSPSKASSSGPASPPLLRLAASPHDAHLLATFASDSNIIRILDVRQPGTALLELRGHQANLNSIEWNPSRRGVLGSGGDDSLVLVWDLLNAGGVVNGGGVAPPGGGDGAGGVQGKGPSASWRCEYEVANVSWAPQSLLTGQGGDWLGVCAGRGVWGVKL